MSDQALPSHARVVVVGGGIVGCAVAYHLAKLGVSDVVLVERETLTSGTTWHAAGVVGSLRPSVLLTHLTVEACKLFPALETETGQSTGYRRTGGLSIAQTRDRFEELKRVPPVGALTGWNAELLGAEGIKEKSPILEVSDLAGGVWIPWDGQTNPTDTTMALARGARMHGAKLIEHTRMTGLKRRNRAVTTVRTDRGDIECEHAVLCCGMWTRHLGNSVGVAVPLQAVEHMYVVTEPMAEVPVDQPFVRDFDAAIYIKGDTGKLLVGSVDPISKPWSVEGIPEDSAFTLLPEDWDHFEPFMEAALKRIPSLEQAGIRQFLNGPESFTVDARHIMGPAPGYDNLFVAAGFNTTGIMTSAGVGHALAQWIVDGSAPMDCWEVDPRRFERWTSTDAFIRERTLESCGLAFAMHWPHRQPVTARNVKRSVVHEQLRARGACFGVVAGWERPMWYAPLGVAPEFDYSIGKQKWWPFAAREAKALSESVALFDQSQMAVFDVEGKDAERKLQTLCANNVAVQPGKVVYTQMLNRAGGIEADLTVTRLTAERFRITTGAPNRVRDRDRLESNLTDGSVVVTDRTSDFAIFTLMGPNSRTLLQSLGRTSLDQAAFPFGTTREIELGYTTVWAQRLSYVGELGYELYVPTETARHVYESIVNAGASYDLAHAGLLCMDACRIEKGYKHWGHELTPSITPLEAGLGFAVDFEKTFIGRDALWQQRMMEPRQRVVLFQVDDDEPLLLHDEPVYRDRKLVGETTSGTRAFRTGGSLCFALIRNPDGCTRDFVMSGAYEIEVGDRRFTATPLQRAPYDPSGTRMRG